MTVRSRRSLAACLFVILVLSACAGDAPSVEPPEASLVEVPRGSVVELPGGVAVSPSSLATAGGGGSPGSASSSSTVVSFSPPVSSIETNSSQPPGTVSSSSTVVPPLEVGGGFSGVFVDVSAGFGYSCGLREGGGVECWEWGRDSASRWDDWWWEGIFDDGGDPVDVEVPEGVFVSVSAGFGNACGLRPSRMLVCWGPNRDVVVSPPGGVFTEVSVGFEHACGVRIDEKVICWGSTGWRQPVDFPPEGVFVDFALAKSFGCGVRVRGSVECWGEGYTAGALVGELPLPEGEFESVAAPWGAFDVCGLRTGGSVECWGNFLEEGNYSYLSPPEGEFASAFFLGGMPCGLRPGGEGECWSSSSSWALPGPGDYPDAAYGEGNACGYDYGIRYCWESGAASPEEVTGIVGGFNYFCGLLSSGEAVCDYFDDYFVPSGSGGERYLYRYPQGESPVEPPEGPFSVLRSSAHFVCGMRPDQSVECWGTNTYGQSSPPEGRFTQLKIGQTFACGLRPSGELECWGYGASDYGYRGHQSKIVPPRGSLTNIHAGWGGLEIRITPERGESIWGDWGYSCGLRPDQSVECWGDRGDLGILGRGWSRVVDTAIRLDHPEGEFTEVGVGKREACGLRPTGTVECWGPDWGNREDWSPTHLIKWSPARDVRSGEGEGYAALSVGGEYTCALLRSSGAVDCWSTDRSETYQLAGPYTAVSAGYGHQCGVLTNGDIHCWEGKNPQDQHWEEITFPANEAT